MDAVHVPSNKLIEKGLGRVRLVVYCTMLHSVWIMNWWVYSVSWDTWFVLWFICKWANDLSVSDKGVRACLLLAWLIAKQTLSSEQMALPNQERSCMASLDYTIKLLKLFGLSQKSLFCALLHKGPRHKYSRSDGKRAWVLSWLLNLKPGSHSAT